LPPGSGRLHVAVKGVIVFFGLGLMMLGVIFLIAGGSENTTAGGVMVGLSLALFAFVYMVDRQDSASMASRPVHQEFNVTMGGSGEMRERKLVCPYCGAPVGEKDVKVSEGGLTLNCSYCHQVSHVEEEPKW